MPDDFLSAARAAARNYRMPRQNPLMWEPEKKPGTKEYEIEVILVPRN